MPSRQFTMRKLRFFAPILVCATLSSSWAVADVDDDHRVKAVAQNITFLSEILGAATNEPERVHWKKRLELAHKELAHAKRLVRLEKEEEVFASERHTTAEENLRVVLATIESDMAEAEDRIEDQVRKIDKLKARRADLETQRNAALEKPEQDADANAERDSLIRNVDAEILSCMILRDTEELRIRLAQESERIDAMRRSIDLKHRITARLILKKKQSVSAASHKSEEFTLLRTDLEEKLQETVTAVELAEERFAQLDEEIRILTGRLKMATKERRFRTMISVTKSEKKLLGARIEQLKRQAEALTSELVIVTQGLALFRAEQAFTAHEYNISFKRYRERFTVPIVLVLAALLIYVLLSRILFPILMSKDGLFVARRAGGYICAFVILAVVSIFFLEDLKSIATVLGIVGAAVVIALQDLCSSFAGWFVIVASRKLKVGDRVEIDQHRGDVIDVQMLRITLLELNNWLGVDEPTGRILVIPNSFIFKSHVFNYSHVHPYITGKIDITVTFESDAEASYKLLLGILEEETREVYEAAQEASLLMEEKYGQVRTIRGPRVHTVIADCGISFGVFYLAHYKEFTAMRDRISTRIAREFNNRKDIAFAYPTERHIPTPKQG